MSRGEEDLPPVGDRSPSQHSNSHEVEKFQGEITVARGLKQEEVRAEIMRQHGFSSDTTIFINYRPVRETDTTETYEYQYSKYHDKLA